MLALAIARETVDAVLKVDMTSFFEERQDFEETSLLICADKVAKVVFNKVHEICEEWKDNPPADYTPTPKVSTHAIKNTRRKMEDKHVTIPDLNKLGKKQNNNVSPVGFYAVYDGHGGIDASHYAATHLHCHIVSHPEYASNKAEALRAGFTVTDDKFVDKARREGLRSGTTGIAMIHDENMLHVGWIGDSQGLVMKQGKAITVMDPHKPDREDEKKRIEELGGCVVWFGAWRVNGSLAVSRAIGDADHRPYVSGIPDIASIKLEGDEDCFILACDGLFDTVSLQDVCDVVQNCINTDSEFSTVSHKLVSVAKERGSTDNITCIVVFLNPQKREITVQEDEETVIVDESENSDGADNKEDKESDIGEDGKINSCDGSEQPANPQETSDQTEAKDLSSALETKSETNKSQTASETEESETVSEAKESETLSEAKESETLSEAKESEESTKADTNINNNNSILSNIDNNSFSKSTRISTNKKERKAVQTSMEKLSLAGNRLKLSPNRKKTTTPLSKPSPVNVESNVAKPKKLSLKKNTKRSTTQSSKISESNGTCIEIVSPLSKDSKKSNELKARFKPKSVNGCQGRVRRDEVIAGATRYDHMYHKGSMPA
ncbi:protein phosphatase 1F-like [Antedon mediterranea]|uniref:protein phosphatase 1F-like n=1 Tax=Antedon mediterranea TaxID=105859 RepID=UPI003AF8F46B